MAVCQTPVVAGYISSGHQWATLGHPVFIPQRMVLVSSAISSAVQGEVSVVDNVWLRWESCSLYTVYFFWSFLRSYLHRYFSLVPAGEYPERVVVSRCLRFLTISGAPLWLLSYLWWRGQVFLGSKRNHHDRSVLHQPIFSFLWGTDCVGT